MEIKKYTEHLEPLYKYVCKELKMNVGNLKVVLHTQFQNEDYMLVKTGYFDPNTNKVHLFLCDNEGYRAPKDVYRSFAHELVHVMQQLNGTIDKSGYTGDKIIEDNKLIKLEAEAYLKGNLIFRKYTEMLQRNKKKPLNESKNGYEGMIDVRTLGDGVFKGQMTGYRFIYKGEDYKAPIGIRSPFPVDVTLQIKGDKVERI